MPAVRRNRTKPGDALYEKTRAKIQVSQLINRLQLNTLGGKDTKGKKVEMSREQIASAKILLDKSLPSLQSTELSSPDGKPVFSVNIHEKQE